MNKAKILSAFTAVLAVIAMLSAADFSGILALFPGEHSGTIALISGTLATLGTVIRAIGDLIDDGVVNNSFKIHPLACLGALVLAVAALASCAELRGVRISGFYQDASGAKAGLSTHDGEVSGRVLVPIRDASGRQVGWGELSATK